MPASVETKHTHAHTHDRKRRSGGHVRRRKKSRGVQTYGCHVESTHTHRENFRRAASVYIYIYHVSTPQVSFSPRHTHIVALFISRHKRKSIFTLFRPLPFSLSLSPPPPPHTHTHSLQPQSQNSINTVFIFLRTASSAINNAALAATLAPKNGIAARVNTRNAADDDIASPLKP